MLLFACFIRFGMNIYSCTWRVVSLEWFRIGFPGEVVKMQERRAVCLHNYPYAVTASYSMSDCSLPPRATSGGQHAYVFAIQLIKNIKYTSSHACCVFKTALQYNCTYNIYRKKTEKEISITPNNYSTITSQRIFMSRNQEEVMPITGMTAISWTSVSHIPCSTL